MIGNVVFSAIVVAVIWMMIWDQVRIGGMRPHKWGIAALLLAVLLASIWGQS